MRKIPPANVAHAPLHQELLIADKSCLLRTFLITFGVRLPLADQIQCNLDEHEADRRDRQHRCNVHAAGRTDHRHRDGNSKSDEVAIAPQEGICRHAHPSSHHRHVRHSHCLFYVDLTKKKHPGLNLRDNLPATYRNINTWCSQHPAVCGIATGVVGGAAGKAISKAWKALTLLF